MVSDSSAFCNSQRTEALCTFLEQHEIGFESFGSAWIHELLIDRIRNLSVSCMLFDMYLSSPNFMEAHVKVCVNILLLLSSSIQALQSSREIHNYLTDMPMLRDWDIHNFERVAEMEVIQDEPEPSSPEPEEKPLESNAALNSSLGV